uniref:Uncharacterized protein n=1 Tax=Lotus japonicus TaxID=34305 RepID=I3STU7_LOTJA|nr:unknown [Lotus japonicus]
MGTTPFQSFFQLHSHHATTKDNDSFFSSFYPKLNNKIKIIDIIYKTQNNRLQIKIKRKKPVPPFLLSTLRQPHVFTLQQQGAQTQPICST